MGMKGIDVVSISLSLVHIVALFTISSQYANILIPWSMSATYSKTKIICLRKAWILHFAENKTTVEQASC